MRTGNASSAAFHRLQRFEVAVDVGQDGVRHVPIRRGGDGAIPATTPVPAPRPRP